MAQLTFYVSVKLKLVFLPSPEVYVTILNQKK